MNAATQSHDSQPVHPIVYLKDYQPPIYLVESVNLNISIFANGTLVNSSLVIQQLNLKKVTFKLFQSLCL